MDLGDTMLSKIIWSTMQSKTEQKLTDTPPPPSPPHTNTPLRREIWSNQCHRGESKPAFARGEGWDLVSGYRLKEMWALVA